MKFEEALAEMRNGKSIRLGQCTCGYSINKYPNYSAILNDAGDIVKLNSCDIMSDDWEIIED